METIADKIAKRGEHTPHQGTKTQQGYPIANLRKEKETIAVGNSVNLRVESGDENEHRHKLAVLAKPAYPVIEVKEKIVVIHREDGTVKQVNRDRKTNAPIPRIEEELQRSTNKCGRIFVKYVLSKQAP